VVLSAEKQAQVKVFARPRGPSNHDEVAIIMIIKRVFRGFASFTILAAMAACSSLPPGPRDILDDRTGTTVSVVGAPIDLEHEANGASAHDYLTLVAIQKDDGGKYTALLLLYRWAVYYGGAPFAPGAGSGELLIAVDGHSIDLQPLPRLPVGLPGPKDLFVPDKTESAMRAYVTDLETLRLISTSHELTVRLPNESPIGSFTLWHDGRAALGQFVRHLSGS
jgi:hypothetical protein